MRVDGSDFNEVLKEAQALGYAERNPEADIEGYDTCRKIAILSSLAFGSQVDYEDVYTEGITNITAKDILFADQCGYSIKLFGTSKKVDGKIYIMVAPAMITEENPLYSVNGVYNGIFVKGNVLGDVMFYGSGVITIIVLIFVVYQFLNTMAGVEFVNQFMAEYKEALKVYMEFYN